jgi:hypothetical protein
MALEDLLSHYVSEAVVPAGAFAVAAGLVRGAKALEKDASEGALRYVSKLLLQRDIGQVGGVAVTLIPLVFDRLFGSRPISMKFISRSAIATLFFWFIFLFFKHYSWSKMWSELEVVTIFLIPGWLIVDWLSLVKARLLLRAVLSYQRVIISALSFFLLDFVISYILVLLSLCLFLAIAEAGVSLVYSGGDLSDLLDGLAYALHNMKNTLAAWLQLNPLIWIYNKPSENFSFREAFVPSTMLTTIWTFGLFVSAIIAQLIAPIDYLRRFAGWWFRDVEHHPLTAIAKVAATLIVIGAFAIKAVRWIY